MKNSNGLPVSVKDDSKYNDHLLWVDGSLLQHTIQCNSNTMTSIIDYATLCGLVVTEKSDLYRKPS